METVFSVVLAIIFCVAMAGIVVSFLALIRNQKVYNYRVALLEEVSNAANNDIHREGGPYEFKWRYDAFSDVEYNDMMWKFWKPLDEFYPDKSFTDPEVVREKIPV